MIANEIIAESNTSLYYFFSTLAQVSIGFVGVLFIFYQIFSKKISSKIKIKGRQLIDWCNPILESNAQTILSGFEEAREIIQKAESTIGHEKNKNKSIFSQEILTIEYLKTELAFMERWSVIFIVITAMLSLFWTVLSIFSSCLLLAIPQTNLLLCGVIPPRETPSIQNSFICGFVAHQDIALFTLLALGVTSIIAIICSVFDSTFYRYFKK